jgi:hypothetical protein
MNTVKTLMLTGLTALSLGMGTAMAQESGDAYPVHQAPSAAAAGGVAKTIEAGQVQSGTSDVPTSPLTWRNVLPYADQG